ncbi:MAG: methyltransferase domain-containing protein, partial [Gammaproteobacteria bacterium]|nr:methyltransferase domain-containing protein [Gammaproteobacteria bacterium]
MATADLALPEAGTKRIRGKSEMAYDRQYSDSILDGMQSAYGEGFLSPGGAEEVRQIMHGLSAEGRDVLDLGCGVGGASLILARELNAGRVVGVDVERQSLERAATAIKAAGLTDRITLKLIEPG